MRKMHPLGALTGVVLALFACNKSPNEPASTASISTMAASSSTASNSATASPKPAAQSCLSLAAFPPPGVTDLSKTAHACVERNAALYAKGPDTADTLSRAVIAKCQTEVLAYIQQAARTAREKPQYPALLEAWRGHALAIIAEARAKQCYG